MEMLEKIKHKQASIGIAGLGYVGLPLATAYAENGFSVMGIDSDSEKVKLINQGINYIDGIDLEKVVADGRLKAVDHYEEVNKLDVMIICVPTPLDQNQQPDISYIVNVMNHVKKRLKKGSLIILESTTYPGTTEEIIHQSVTEEGFIVGEDIYICFSPERIDPGNLSFTIKNTTKVIGGITPKCLERGQLLYSQIIDTVFPVSSPRVAEMSKLLENTFRSINIAFINEMALMCEKLEVNIWEVIKAASTKPFGFMPFYPGPGIGGHCIPLDPMYLSWKARGENFYSRFIETAQEINKQMPQHIVSKISEILNEEKKCLNGASILLLGMAYKPNVSDCRESPSLDVYELLTEMGAKVSVNEPFCENIFDRNGAKMDNRPLHYSQFAEYDCVVLLTPHSMYDPDLLTSSAKALLDTRNLTDGIHQDHVYVIGSPVKKRKGKQLLPN
ncbi:nucleotide sugar dehydrogenase [Bacillus subtilis]|uniref:nucleotide sugar dehydrogenase n=1 Tax=Bacillus subtilis TaxID=1423 RepID=UPI0027A59A1C|nr:nucleotide sugar dehydrogenase [Bacillus subtilis]MEC2401099.1 nucleotide sugar dehydrogenase [Bacillus subtilis]MED4663364.1 nucleotide sugar dehydrogenase [Bacillus subtilis]MED4666098.1 nucleotide sugar dehydrogenase [Bacillus subtilis]WEZ29378.1 nucleotide sugar dehydrogenase [Bacillus subtilis]